MQKDEITDAVQHEDPEKYSTGGDANPMVLDPGVEKRLIRKMDTHILPLVMAMYLLAFLDRGNIGNANTAGMSKSLGLDDAAYTWLLTIFYISYIIVGISFKRWMHR
jgi:sugar phosphate permease